MQHPPRSATSSTRPTASPLPRAQTAQSNTRILDTVSGRILCIADVRGRLSSLNDLAKEVGAKAVIHTGDFGFFGKSHIIFIRFFFSADPGRDKDRALRSTLLGQCTSSNPLYYLFLDNNKEEWRNTQVLYSCGRSLEKCITCGGISLMWSTGDHLCAGPNLN